MGSILKGMGLLSYWTLNSNCLRHSADGVYTGLFIMYKHIPYYKRYGNGYY